MNTTQAFSLFVAAIMVTSIAAFAITAASGDQPTKPPEPPPIDQPTVLSFSAENLDANVVEVFGTLYLTASTSEAEISKIEAELIGIEGVKRLTSSSYRSAAGTSIAGGLLYIAELSFDRKFSPAEVAENISKESTFLTVVETGVFGLVSLPKTVALVNPDLNLTKSYEFPDPLRQSYLSIDSVKGDNILVSVRMQFSGEAVYQFVAYEALNLTAQPKPVSLEESFQLSSLSNNLGLFADFNYTGAFTAESLEEELSQLEGAESVEVVLSELFPRIRITLDGNFEDRASDINITLNSIPAITEVFLVLDRNRLLVDFDQNSNYPELKSDLVAGLSSLQVPEQAIHIEDPVIQMRTDVNTSSTSISGLSENALSLLSSKGISAESYQRAVFDVESLTDPESGSVFSVDGNSFKAFVLPGHAEGELVGLVVSFSGVRGIARNVVAVEMIESQEETVAENPEEN